MYQQPHDKGFRFFWLKVINLNMEQAKTKMHLNNPFETIQCHFACVPDTEWKFSADKGFF